MSGSTGEHASVLFVGGVDSSGHAGLDADRAAAAEFDVTGTFLASAMTDQDLFHVRSVEERLLWHREAEEELARDGVDVRALKFGLLPGVGSIIEAARLVARARHGSPVVPAVVDPVISSSSGYRFWSDRELVAVRDSLLVAGPILTPNLDELAILGWEDRDRLDRSDDARVRAATRLVDSGVSAVVAKGGHGPRDEGVRDLVLVAGEEPQWIEREREPGGTIRGSGCRFAAAIACALALGRKLPDATRAAGDHVASAVRHAATEPEPAQDDVGASTPQPGSSKRSRAGRQPWDARD